MNIGNSNWYIGVTTSRKWGFWVYFSSIQDYWPPSTWKPLVHISWGEMEQIESEINNVHWLINLYMNIGISSWHIGSIDRRKWGSWLYFSSIHDYCDTSTWNSLVHMSWGEMFRCEKRAYRLLKMRKKDMSWNIKTKCVTDVLWIVSSSKIKDYTFH